MSARLPAALSVLLLTSFASAQLPGPGISWTGTTAAVRSFLPSCTDFPVAAVVNEVVEVRVWGDQQAPFVLLAGPSARQCLPIPGVGNFLMLDMPVIFVAAGVLTRTSPCLSCPPGYEPLQFVIPAGFPPGGSVSFQGVSYGARNLSFTASITATVR